MADEKLPKSKIAELGGVQTKDEWKYRFIVMEDGTKGEHWSKDQKVFDAHEQLFKDGVEVEYTWAKGAKDKGDKLRIYPPKEEDKKDSGKRPSEYTKDKREKDNSYAERLVWEKGRTALNDKKIEMQHYQNLVAPFFLEYYKGDPDASVEDTINLLDKKAIELYNRHNPTTPAADVTDEAPKAKKKA